MPVSVQILCRSLHRGEFSLDVKPDTTGAQLRAMVAVRPVAIVLPKTPHFSQSSPAACMYVVDETGPP
jgi:hypothetical protein